MIQQQIDQFARTLQNLSVQYSDPGVIVQHIPVLKDNLLLQQNPEYLFYGIGGVIALLFLKRRIAKHRRDKQKNIALVMPQPYVGAADAAHTAETAPESFSKDVPGTARADADDPRLAALAARGDAARTTTEPAARTPEQHLDAVSALSFTTKPAFTPDEARMRVIVQSVINEYGAGYMIMARAALNALVEPGCDAVGPDRAHALSAIADKYIDFGIFDRAGRLVLALDVTSDAHAIGTKAQDRTIIAATLRQAGLSSVKLTFGETPQDVRTKIAPYLQATAQAPAAPQAIAQPVALKPNRPAGRPARPARPTRPASIAAE